MDIKILLYEYQTLLTGIMAIVVGFFTAFLLLVQIRNEREYLRDVRFRRLRASKALLPLALSDIISYADGCTTISKIIYTELLNDHKSNKTEQGERIKIPELHKDTLHIIKECLEDADGEAASQIITLLRFMQIQRARLRSQIENHFVIPDDHNRPLRIAEHALYRLIEGQELIVRAENLLPYSRNEADKPLERSILPSVLQRLAVNDGAHILYPAAIKRVQSLIEAGHSSSIPDKIEPC